MASTDTYTSLIALLDEHGAQYRLIDHPPEGRTELVARSDGVIGRILVRAPMRDRFLGEVWVKRRG
jgi:hypothetical protein